jgi:hypothetical protein
MTTRGELAVLLAPLAHENCARSGSCRGMAGAGGVMNAQLRPVKPLSCEGGMRYKGELCEKVTQEG